MDRKQGVIHLGRSKSPSRLKAKSITTQLRTESYASSRQKQQTQQSVMNRSINISSPSRVVLVDGINYSNTSPLFFPPTKKLVHQNGVEKENNRQTPQKVGIMSATPFKRVVVSRPISTKENSYYFQQENQKLERQQQLVRKLKVLENRIQQVHQQKQTMMVRSHDQTKRLNNENILLRNQMQQLTKTQNIKNIEISELKKQINNLKYLFTNQLHVIRTDRVQKTAKPSAFYEPNKNQVQKGQVHEKNQTSLKNSPYFQDQSESPSILRDKQKQIKESRNYDKDRNQLQELELKLKDQQQNSSGLRKIISEQSLQIQKWSKQFKKITQQLENSSQQKKQLVLQMQGLKANIQNSSHLIEQNNNKIVEGYQNKIHILTSELQRMKYEAGLLQSQLCRSRQQTEQCMGKILQNDEQQLRKQQKWEIQMRNCLNKIRQMQQKYEQCLKKIQEQQQQLNKRLNKQEQTCQQSKQQKIKKQQCNKCKQLIKTLLKLNQKVYTRTI